ncbi:MULTISPECIES: hybrid sensor histidine kinase/response regulator [Methylomonas]|uniref:Chemotaxis protein CheA n=1 Tax=Methylomonas koyamae TaxID=702114 RepID=A0A177P4C1_9GAMM|nr:response regulator [Methylomonas koyamae]OAI25158.1 hypothetical protein A1355_19825 [Methylomonas koyamae]
MSEQESEFLQRLLATFNIEAQEHVEALFAGIAELEKCPDETRQAELIEAVFREAHSLKGAARAVNLIPVETACQALETGFAAMKNKNSALTAELFDSLYTAIGKLSERLGLPQIDRITAVPVEIPAPHPETQTITSVKPPARGSAEKLSMAGTVRIASAKLDSIFLKSEEMLAAKFLAQQRQQDIITLQAMAASWSKQWSRTVSRPEFYSNLSKQPQGLELIEQNTAFIKSLNYRLDAAVKAARQDQHLLGRMVDDLLEDMKKALMLPFSALMEIFPRLVRDLAKSSGKDIVLNISGGEIEADRRILEEIKDPLIHILRNCVDHGIELPDIRANLGKSPCGTIGIAILPRSGNRIEIDISDDGAGIDTTKVKAAATRLGILEREQASRLEDHVCAELIYRSGVSTSPIITEISGRGLGLAIVREKIEGLGGCVAVETQPGNGTVFRIELPLTLATYRGIAVRVGEQTFVLPTGNVERCMRIRRDDIRTVENRETILFRDETLSLSWLSEVLGMPERTAGGEALYQLLVLKMGGKRMAFIVDEVLGEQEVLVKSLGPQLARVRNIAAATILGSGKLAPILNVSDLLKSAQLAAQTGSRRTADFKTDGPTPTNSVLVVEDSVTARSLLKGILEMAGYKVTTANDGAEGLTQLRSGEFDLVVSDVDMPRMNGFDLTAKIRADKRLADLPVVLVTALESREDKERGIEVGANAYIVKGSFEQSNLLDIVRRLI